MLGERAREGKEAGGRRRAWVRVWGGKGKWAGSGRASRGSVASWEGTKPKDFLRHVCGRHAGWMWLRASLYLPCMSDSPDLYRQFLCRAFMLLWCVCKSGDGDLCGAGRPVGGLLGLSISVAVVASVANFVLFL